MQPEGTVDEGDEVGVYDIVFLRESMCCLFFRLVARSVLAIWVDTVNSSCSSSLSVYYVETANVK